MSLNESEKRDFLNQLVTIIDQNKERLTEKGFDPAVKIEQLNQKITVAQDAEARQADAAAAAKDATKLAQDTLEVAYVDGSATVDLISGLLGKNDNLVIEIKKLRKTGRSSKPKPDPVQP